MFPSLTDTLPTDWSYLSEGGATIVFSYKGPSNPSFNGTVLRLRKRVLGSEDEDHHSEIDFTIDFQKEIIERLIPRAHLPRLVPVVVGEDAGTWLEALAAACEPHRPAERRRTDHIDVKSSNAVLATDLVGGQIIAVEIKPKWGFLPSPTFLSDATRSIKTRTCRFCMHSHLKAQQGDVVALGYCSLDLFSGDESRVKNALSSLWDAWMNSDGAMNNLKVFVHGKKIGPVEQSCILDLLDDATDPKEALISALLPILTATPVLRTLAHLQRTLDALDIEGLAALWDRAPVGPDPTMSEWTDFIATYLAAPSLPPADSAHLRHHALAYLLSATLKDCSVIVRVPDGTVAVIDLDAKHIDRLRKWARLDAEIVRAYAAVPERKVCVDALRV
ncbi:inositol-pentakisphosphate 2-kinase [Mycena maculata]|uniref:Inositol-pentakisphosphate 2-kinase n=1 Tax=Mycena maculata TaxID=230809 RepID=A0AAD7ISF6_9AGAR|nr:inositol-pentakisphosphate 2-kinase [Mycena maculata]